ALHSVLHDGKREFSYDARGNRTATGDTRYRYDGLDRLIEVTTPSHKTTYSYDAFDRRIEKKQYTFEDHDWILESHERYLYAGQNEIGCADAAGRIFQLRVLGEGLGAEIGAAVAIELESFLHVPIHDHRGNVVTLLSSDGDVVESYRYDAYGNEEIFSPIDSGNPWRFSSKRVDPETGLVYFGRRYYDPSIGKWLTHDPLGLKAGPNLYAYVLNNPMTGIDLYGLYGIRDAIATVEVIGYTCAEFTVIGYTSTASLATAAVSWSVNAIDYEPLSKAMAPVVSHLNAANAAIENAISSLREGVFSHARSISDNISPEGIYSATDSTLTVASICSGVGAVAGTCKAVMKATAKNSTIAGAAKAAKNAVKAPPTQNAPTSASRKTLPFQSLSNETHYVPKCPETGNLLTLPRSPHGVDLPSSYSPHTQLGAKVSDKTGLPYRQTREWGYDGKPIKRTDWTDHGMPEVRGHEIPHDHWYSPNSTGGTPKPRNATPFTTTDPSRIEATR
ncbi:MAG: RHS repeat-associated core domain-containing protein, partial [Verrucomicrobia bacterium]|nr:RHS repeat-associated core domain-containing protein [Verrucomicrobiota bacterium]